MAHAGRGGGSDPVRRVANARARLGGDQAGQVGQIIHCRVAIRLPTSDCSILFGSCGAGWTGLEDGAGDELDRTHESPASRIAQLRVVGRPATELGEMVERSGCNSVTNPGETAVELVCQGLQDALRAWEDLRSASALRRRLHRLLLELDERD